MNASAPDLKTVFSKALEIPEPAERARYVAEACGEDARLRAEVEGLLGALNKAGSFLEAPAAPLGPTLDEPVREDLGTIIGPYKLLQQIGEGGMGVVFMAEQQEPIRRKVALKVLKPGMDTRQVVARFEAERQILAIMDHPNIAKVLDAGETSSGRPYFVMDLVRGASITEFCDQAQLTPRERLDLFVTVCQAVQHAHQKGIIHRDIKPSNILVTLHDGTPLVKVIDFGIAKAMGQQLTDKTLFTGFAQMIGTPLYMSPEQTALSNIDVDTRSDIYSLGVLLYELLTGSTPFEKERFKKAAYDEIRRIIREEEPPKPSTRLSDLGGSGLPSRTDPAAGPARQAGPTSRLASVSALRRTEPAKLTKLVRGELDWITMKALEKDRNRRYETASAFAADVQRYLDDEPVQACPPSAMYRLRKFMRRNRKPVLTAALVLLALVAGTGISAWQAIRATRAEGRALDERDAKEEALKAALANEREAKTAAAAEQAAKTEAAKAASAEKMAKELAQKRLGQIEKANAILMSIFRDLDPRLEAKGGPTLKEQLVQRLDQAAAQLAVGDTMTVTQLQATLGHTYSGLEEPAKAIALLSKAYQSVQVHLGADHPQTLFVLDHLAGAYRQAGQFHKAVSLYQEAVAKMQVKLGADDPNTLAAMNNLALAYLEAGQLGKAVPLFEDTLVKMKVKVGADHTETLAIMQNLGIAYGEAGQLGKAVPLLKEVLDKSSKVRGTDHVTTLAIMQNLGIAYREAGQLGKAVPLLEEALAKTKAKLGADHVDTLTVMVILGNAYREAGQLGKAVPLLEEAMAKTKAKLGVHHFKTLDAKAVLATAYLDSDQLPKALPLLEEVLAKRREQFGPDHAATLQSMNFLALAYQHSGQLPKAVPLFEEVLAKRREKLGTNHPDTLVSMSNLAFIYQAAGRFDSAESLFREVVDHTRKKHGAESPATAQELAMLGLNLLMQKKHEQAEPVLRECLKIREQQQPERWGTFNTKSMLGGSLLGQKKYADAEPLLLAGYEGMKERAEKIPAQGKIRLTESVERLVQLYEAWGQKDKVDAWRKKLPVTKSAKPAETKKD